MDDKILATWEFRGIKYEAREHEGQLAIYAWREDQEAWELVSYPYIP